MPFSMSTWTRRLCRTSMPGRRPWRASRRPKWICKSLKYHSIPKTMSHDHAKNCSFPSPKNIRKTHKPVFWSAGTPNKENNGSVNHSSQSMHPKRLFGTPKLSAAAVAQTGRRGSGPSTTPMTPPKPMRLPRTPAPNTTATTATTNGVATTSTSSAFSALAAAATVTQSFQTPLNKVRGLFSKYREPRVEMDSPMTGMNGTEEKSFESAGSAGTSDGDC